MKTPSLLAVSLLLAFSLLACGGAADPVPPEVSPLTTPCVPDLAGYSTPPVRTAPPPSLDVEWFTCRCAAGACAWERHHAR